MNRKTLTLIPFLFLAACGGSEQATEAPEPAPRPEPAGEMIAFTGAAVWDGLGPSAIENATLLVRDGRVVGLGTREPPAGATVVDLAGRWVVPGFVNAHGHASGRWAAADIEGDAARVEGDLELYARYGVTTVLSLGGAPVASFGLRTAQGSPDLDRARLMVAGDVVFSQDPDEAVAIAEANIENGVDWIKLRVDDNLGTAEKMAWPAVEATMTTAAFSGLRVATHVFYMDDTARLLEMGTGLVAHSVRDQRVTDEFVQALLESGVCYVPTLVREVSTFVYAERPAWFDDPFFTKYASESEVARVSEPEFMAAVAARPSSAGYRAALAQAQENLGILAAAGVPIAFGTDSGPAGRFLGYFEHLEFDLMQASGMSPRDILLSATSVAADCLGLDDVGRLSTGRWADFVVLSADPLASVDGLHAVERVFISGNEVPR